MRTCQGDHTSRIQVSDGYHGCHSTWKTTREMRARQFPNSPAQSHTNPTTISRNHWYKLYRQHTTQQRCPGFHSPWLLQPCTIRGAPSPYSPSTVPTPEILSSLSSTSSGSFALKAEGECCAKLGTLWIQPPSLERSMKSLPLSRHESRM